MGDMDFKVAGTRTGITAARLDVKTRGTPRRRPLPSSPLVISLDTHRSEYVVVW